MNKEFLFTLLDNMSVSGNEIEMQKRVIKEMEPYCDKVMTDYTGNVISVINPDADFKVMLFMFEHLRNASSPIAVTDSGITTSSSKVQL